MFEDMVCRARGGVVVLVGVFLAVVVGCGAPVVSPSGQPTIETATQLGGLELGELEDYESGVLRKYATALRTIADDGVWRGFDDAKIPQLFIYKDDQGVVSSVFAVAHPNLDALGTARKVNTASIGLEDVYEITDLKDENKIADLFLFTFDTNFGGVRTFTITSTLDVRGDSATPEAATADFAAFWIHELFHRYQFDNFAMADYVDYDSYDFLKENLELAILEDYILVDAAKTENTSELEVRARQFVALRQFRLNRHRSTEIDNAQEQSEGTARYIEHKIGDEIGLNLYRDTTYADETEYVVRSDYGDMPVKEYFAFDRFYGTGAIIMDIAERLAVPNRTALIERGGSPFDLLKNRYGADSAELQALIDAGRQAVDPMGAILAIAEAAAKRASSEPSVEESFGDS